VKRYIIGAALLVLAAAIVVVYLAPFSDREPAVQRGGGRPNVVLVTIDTLRADRVGSGLTPALDGLAASGIRFLNARATVPLTLPSHVSIMTGTLPPEHGVRDNGVVFTGGVPPLARALRDAGYHTAAFVGAYVLDRRFGLADGFETYDDNVRRDPDAMGRLEAERRASDVIDPAIVWLDQARQPFLLWVHLYDPHAPYEAPSGYQREPGSHPYDAEVAYADAQTARLLQRLRERGLAEGTLVAVMGDHGEGLGEHGERTHGMLAYDSTLRVPLIVAGPGIDPGVVSRAVSLADLAPAVLRHAGVAGSGDEDAAGLLHDRGVKKGDVYSETEYGKTAGWHPIATLAGDQWKLILSSEPELYDLAADPAEAHNLAGEHVRLVQGMSAKLKQMRSVSVSQPPAGAVTPEARERLRALGYVSAGPAVQASSDAPNPARVIEAWNRFEAALTQLNSGAAGPALATFRELAATFPTGPVFQSTYARTLLEVGRSADALAVYRDAVGRWPSDAALFHDLAVAARAAGRADEAMRAEQAALAIEATNPAALNGLGLLHADAGRPAEAAPLFERAAHADPSNASYWANLGNARRELGSVAQAESAYTRALEADPAHADAANGLGVLLVQSGRAAAAIPWLERALQWDPDFHEARLNLGIAYQEGGQKDRAAATYRDLLARAPASAARERKAAAELLRTLK
jgi:choline-sulfatase